MGLEKSPAATAGFGRDPCSTDMATLDAVSHNCPTRRLRRCATRAHGQFRMFSCARPAIMADRKPAWMARPINSSWNAPGRAISGRSRRWRGVTPAGRTGSPAAFSGVTRSPRRSSRTPCCGSGSMRRAGAPRPRSAPGSIGSWSISASTRSAVPRTFRSRPPMTWPIPRPERMRSWSSANATGACRRDRRVAGPPARRDRAHLSGRVGQRRGRCRARHFGVGLRGAAGPRQARAADGARYRLGGAHERRS